MFRNLSGYEHAVNGYEVELVNITQQYRDL
jgi:hypothetical protein